MEQRQCICCRARFTPLRNPDQRYCANQACQKKRRCKYQKHKLKRDADYKETHRSSQQKWRNKHPNYWREYRMSHPMYAQLNCVRQARRDLARRKRKRKNTRVFLLANMYSLIPKNTCLSDSYKIILCDKMTCKYVLYRQEVPQLVSVGP